MSVERISHSAAPSLEQEIWELTLFVAGKTDVTRRARIHLEEICRKYLADHCLIEVIDILEDPQQADLFDIIATPTLVRRQPQPMRKIIGDLSLTDKVLMGLGLSPRGDGC